MTRQGGRRSRPTRSEAKPSEGRSPSASEKRARRPGKYGCRGTALAAPLPDVPDVIDKPGSVSPRAAMGIIRLGAALLRRSSALTRAPALRRVLRTSRPRRCAYSSLLREGLAPPPVTRLSRVGSYPTISTLPDPPRTSPLTARRGSTAIGGVVSVALSLGSPRVAVNDLPALWSPDFPPLACDSEARSSDFLCPDVSRANVQILGGSLVEAHANFKSARATGVDNVDR